MLTVVMIMVTCAPSYASIANKDNYNENLTSLFYEATDDEIVAYYKGEPIYKKDIIIKTGEIKKGRIDEIKKINKSLEKNEINLNEMKTNIQPFASIPSGYTEAVVEKVVSFFGFFSSARDADLAAKLKAQTSKGYNVVWTILDNSYGVFHAVDYWNGSNIDLSLINDSYATEKLRSLSYR